MEKNRAIRSGAGCFFASVATASPSFLFSLREIASVRGCADCLFRHRRMKCEHAQTNATRAFYMLCSLKARQGNNSASKLVNEQTRTLILRFTRARLLLSFRHAANFLYYYERQSRGIFPATTATPYRVRGNTPPRRLLPLPESGSGLLSGTSEAFTPILYA
jgi:hypothetical protein